MRNHWVSRFDTPFAQWQLVFPPPKGEPDLRRILGAASQILTVGEAERVYRVVETRGPHPFRVQPGWTYADFLESELEASRFPLFDVGYGVAATGEGRLRTPGQICFYQPDGSLATEDVDDLGELLIRLRSVPPEAGRHNTAAVAPVTLQSRAVPLPPPEEDSAGRRSVRIVIELQTDIWFPQTRGYLERNLKPPDYAPRWYDNRELAACHTPRLNRFLRGARTAVLEHGGEWTRSPSEDCVEAYASMVGEEGVLLDAEPSI
jgi:hypothetical protein